MRSLFLCENRSPWAIVGTVLFSFTLAGCPPREAYLDSIDAFGKANASLVTVVTDASKDIRTQRRLHHFKFELVRSLNNNFSEPLNINKANLLCIPRADYTGLQIQQAKLNSVAGIFKDLSAPLSDDLMDLLKALGNDYSRTIAIGPDPTTTLTSCKKDLNSFQNTVYPIQGTGGQEAGLIAAVSEIYDILKEVVVPVVKKGLKEIDSTRRAIALQQFLKKQENRDTIFAAINTSQKIIDEVATRRRHEKVKAYSDTMNEFLKIDGRKEFIQHCKEFANGSSAERARDNVLFQACFKIVWDSWNKGVEMVLLTAVEYDAEADQSADTAALRLRTIAQDLQALSDGKITADLGKAIFEVAVRLATLEQDVHKTVSSEDNKKKIKTALDDFRAALGNL